MFFLFVDKPFPVRVNAFAFYIRPFKIPSKSVIEAVGSSVAVPDGDQTAQVRILPARRSAVGFWGTDVLSSLLWWFGGEIKSSTIHLILKTLWSRTELFYTGQASKHFLRFKKKKLLECGGPLPGSVRHCREEWFEAYPHRLGSVWICRMYVACP